MNEDRPLHVLIVVQNLPVPLDRRVWLEATALREAGFDVTIIAFADAGQSMSELLDGIRIVRYPSPPDASSPIGYIFEFAYCWIWTATRAWQVWRAHRFDVMQACNPPETFWLLALLFRSRGVRFIFDHHDLSPEMYLAKGGRRGGLLHRGLCWLEKKTFDAADIVIATNESHAAIARGRGKVPASRVVVVRNGPDTSRLRVLPPEPEIKRGKEFLVGYLGEMCVQDGVDQLLLAAREIVVARSREDVGFVLVGGGPDLNRLRTLSVELGLEKYVHFTGRAPDELLCRILSTVDVCVDPDPLTEWSTQSTMNKIMEYMFFGKPIVAYPLEENRRSAGDAALYVEANDPSALAAGILRLLGSPEERRTLGEYGAQRVRRSLMWNASVPRLLDAYERARR